MPDFGKNLSDYDYDLPESFIAQYPVEPRDQSKLMALNRKTGRIAHTQFSEIIHYLNPNDLLVINETRVFPARLLGHKKTGARIEVLLLTPQSDSKWTALVKPARKLKLGEKAFFGENQLCVEIVEEMNQGERVLTVDPGGEEFFRIVEKIGHVPLPPYIRRTDQPADRQNYQTVYSQHRGSVAAPTAGLHFTNELLEKLQQKGIQTAPVTLHIGLDTFRPVNVADIREHQMHSEYYEISAASAAKINQAREQGGRIIAVGTTSVRTLETVANANGTVQAANGWSRLFIYPGYRYKVVDGIITNFHLPKSSLMMMISAFCSIPILKAAYETAKNQHYRFFSYGDAMLLL